MKKIFYLLYIITTSFFMACEKEEHLVNKNNEQLPQNPKDTVQNKFRQLYINLHQLCKNTALYLHLV